MSNGGPRIVVHKERDEVVGDSNDMPYRVGFSTPNVARIYDYYLGGKDNYAADREAARRVLGVAPDVPLAALENREFIKRVIRFLIREQGISQFLDIGPGLPTQGNVHQLALQHDAGARVLYVDNDAVVLGHAKSLLRGVSGVNIVSGDLREPERVLSQPDLRAFIDFSQPVALFMTLVLHFIPPDDDPQGIVRRFRDALCPGSFLVLSHVTCDGRATDTLTEISDTYAHANAPLIMRTHAEITRFFEGFDLVDPGVVFLSQWRPTTEYYAEGGTRWGYGGVGKKS